MEHGKYIMFFAAEPPGADDTVPTVPPAGAGSVLAVLDGGDGRTQN